MIKMNYWNDKKIVITGGAGFLGRHVVNLLLEKGVEFKNIVIPRKITCNLLDLNNCINLLENADILIHLAANIGGIGYSKKNNAIQFYENAQMGLNILEAARINDVKKTTLIGTVCSYPKNVNFPITEDMLWTGEPEKTHYGYGMAKRMLNVMSKTYSEDYGLNSILLLLSNLYGPGDNFSDKKSHVIPALIKKILSAKNDESDIILWGTGKATRDFLFVEDAANAIITATEKYNKTNPVNISSGLEISIYSLAQLLKKILNYDEGEIILDKSKPDGSKRRLYDNTKAKIEFGFTPSTSLEVGLKKTIDWYLSNYI